MRQPGLRSSNVLLTGVREVPCPPICTYNLHTYLLVLVLVPTRAQVRCWEFKLELGERSFFDGSGVGRLGVGW